MNSVSIRKLNGYTGDSNPQPQDCRSIALFYQAVYSTKLYQAESTASENWLD